MTGTTNQPTASPRERPLDSDLGLPEPEFRIDYATFHLDVGSADEAMRSYLAQKVAAAPTDLLAHTRRILLAQRCNDRQEALGALVDLFIATGAKGQGLRQRLLDACGPVLADEHRRLLNEKMTTGWPADLPSPSPASLLPSGRIGSVAIVSRSDLDSDAVAAK
jgi:hypothetical protein